MDTSPILRACSAAGGPSALATALGVSPQAVYLWAKGGTVPAKRVLDVERVTGVPRHELRPDLYPPSEYGVRAPEAA